MGGRADLAASIVMAAVLTACGGGDDEEASATTEEATTSTAERTTTTTEPDLSLSDEGFFEACGHVAIDRIVGDESVDSYIEWLRQSRFEQLQELADEMAHANPAGVEAAVSELTRLCAQTGYDFPE